MTKQEAKERFTTALWTVIIDRTKGFPPFGELAPDIESWPLTRLGGEQPLTIFEWLTIASVCLSDTTSPTDLSRHDRGVETTVGDLIAAIQEAHAAPERRPEQRGV